MRTVSTTLSHMVRDAEVDSAGSSRVLTVLEFLAGRSAPAPAAIISRVCGIPRSSTYALLDLLKRRGFVTYHPKERAWSLGPAVCRLNANAPLLVQGLSVLRALGMSSGQMSLDEIVASCGLSKAAVAPVVAQLADAKLVTSGGSDVYELGLGLVGLAARVRWVDGLRIVARSYLVRLRDATRETANLLLLDGDEAVYVEQVESRFALRHSGWVGRRVSLSGTATGAAFAEPGKAQIVADAVEIGVTSAVCALDAPTDRARSVAVGITGPTWRVQEFGVDRAKTIVETVAKWFGRELTASS